VPNGTQPDTTIVDWDARYGGAFGRLNREWLDKYFRVEPVDEPVLDDPETNIITSSPIAAWARLWPCMNLRDSGTNPHRSPQITTVRMSIWSIDGQWLRNRYSRYFPGESATFRLGDLPRTPPSDSRVSELRKNLKKVLTETESPV
jgi:hypothetical protein